MQPHLVWTKPTQLVAIFTLLMFIALIIGLAIIAVATRSVFYSHVLLNPSVDAPWAQVAVAMSLSLDLLALLYLTAFLAPLPFKNFGLSHAMHIAEQVNPVVERQLREEHFVPDWADREDMIRRGYLNPEEPDPPVR